MTDLKSENFTPSSNLVATNSKSKPSKSKITSISKNIALVIVLGSISILLGLLILLYKKVYLSNTRIITSMTNNMLNLNTLDYEGDLNINFEGDFSKTSPLLPNKYMANSSFSGAVVRLDDNDLSFTSDISLVSQNLFSINFDSRYLNRKLFINIKNIPDFGLPFTDEFVNQWIRIDANKFAGSFNTTDFKKYLKRFPLISVKPLEKIISLKDEEINGADAYHYSFKINKDDLLKLLVDFTNTNGIVLDDGDIKTLNKIKDRMTFNEGEMWIDKKNLYLRKIAISAELSGDENTDQKIFVEIHVNLDNFNKPVTILEPQESKPIESITLPLFSQKN